jgi:osmotically-inducible protein OsmY
MIGAVLIASVLGAAATSAVALTARPRPVQQPPGTRSDGEITRLIREALRRDKSLSAAARKVQVETVAGYVTLKGRVRSAQEKTVVEAKAAQIAGDDYVTSQLTAPKPPPPRPPKPRRAS